MAKFKVRVDFDKGTFCETTFEVDDKRAEEILVACLDKKVSITKPLTKKEQKPSWWKNFKNNADEWFIKKKQFRM